MGQALSGVKKKCPNHLKMSEKKLHLGLDRTRSPVEPPAKIRVGTLQSWTRAFFN